LNELLDHHAEGQRIREQVRFIEGASGGAGQPDPKKPTELDPRDPKGGQKPADPQSPEAKPGEAKPAQEKPSPTTADKAKASDPQATDKPAEDKKP